MSFPFLVLPQAPVYYDSILEGEQYKFPIVIENKGAEPLLIYQIQTALSCFDIPTILKPIFPFRKDTISLTFSTTGRGNRHIQTKVYIQSNSFFPSSSTHTDSMELMLYIMPDPTRGSRPVQRLPVVP